MARLDDLQYSAVIPLLEALSPDGWTEVRVRYSKVGPMAECVGYYLDETGNSHSFLVPTQTVLTFGEIKKEMATPEHGTWLSASLCLTQVDRKMKFSYNYDERPPWDVEPTDEAYIEELAKYPRIPSEIPNWYPSAD